jgi:CBS domain containing-hemolysin-like protein
MTMIFILLMLALLPVLLIASYVDRLYSERGRFLSREFQENIDAWEELAEPKLGFDGDQIALSAAVLMEIALAAEAVIIGAWLFIGPRPTLSECVQAAIALLMMIVLFNRLLPYLFFTQTRGRWVTHIVFPLRLIFYLIMPVTILLSFLQSVVSLAEPTDPKTEETPAEAVEALIEAGREEGILEESDRELVRSAVEFGDKVVREVMTPRPQIFAVQADMLVWDFKQLLRVHAYSRVPVYAATLDEVTGIVFAHDLLQISDGDSRKQTVGSIMRPAVFVPETKPVSDLLRDMQRQKQHMCIVIDEYGAVSGLVTIEDLLEEIVGNISDEHESGSAPVPDASGAFVLPGSYETAQLERLWPGKELELPEDVASTTLGGLLSEVAGHIPAKEEVVLAGNLRFEVLAANSRRVERVKVSNTAVPA